MIDDDHLCFAIADVSGKGVPASLFMAVTKTLFKATASNGGTPGEILARLNAEICRDNESCMFVTFFCAILNIRTGQVDYRTAGTTYPNYLHHSGVTPLENPGGRALGVVEQSPDVSGRMGPQPWRARRFTPRSNRGYGFEGEALFRSAARAVPSQQPRALLRAKSSATWSAT